MMPCSWLFNWLSRFIVATFSVAVRNKVTKIVNACQFRHLYNCIILEFVASMLIEVSS